MNESQAPQKTIDKPATQISLFLIQMWPHLNWTHTTKPAADIWVMPIDKSLSLVVGITAEGIAANLQQDARNILAHGQRTDPKQWRELLDPLAEFANSLIEFAKVV